MVIYKLFHLLLQDGAMANNLIDLPKIEDMSNGLFGKSDPFAAQKPAASVSSLLGDFVKDANKPIELSAGAQKMVTEGLNAAQNVFCPKQCLSLLLILMEYVITAIIINFAILRSPKKNCLNW